MNACSIILDDPKRLAAVQESGLLSSSLDEAFQQLNRLATIVLRTPVSIFSVFGNEKQYFKSFVGLPESISPGAEFSVDISVCKHALEGKPIQFFDTKNEPEFRDNPAVQQLGIAGYLGIPVITKEGHPLGTVCVFDVETRQWSAQDIENLQTITNSFITEVELRIALKRSEDEVAKREEFMAIAAHEMKNPLTSMKLHSDLCQLKIRKGSFEQKDFENYLGIFDRQFKRVNVLIDDMFDASRIRSGQFSVQPEPSNLSDLLHILSENFHLKFSDSGGELEVSCETNLTGSWDTFRLEQVLTNLLSNALKYAPGAKVLLAAKRAGQKITISVQDSGPGISEEAQKKLFLAFERSNVKKDVSGLGLGLYISRQIITQHGGDLEISSQLGIGSTFTITLPVARLHPKLIYREWNSFQSL